MVVVATTVAWLVQCPPSLPTPSTNYRTGDRLVFPQVPAGPAAIDGLATDPVWASGFRFVMEDGGSNPAATMRGVADPTNIYLYLEVEDVQFDNDDVVVIGLNPDNAATSYHRIHIQPCQMGGAGCPANGNTLSAFVSYWTGTFSGGAYTWTLQPLGSGGIVAKSATATAGSAVKWSIEVSIPRAAPFNFAGSNFFGLFVDIVRADPPNLEATQYTWPPNQYIGGPTEDDTFTDLFTGTLTPDKWGNATLSSAFGNGVSINSNDFRSNHPTDPNKLRINDPNIFYATAANYTSSGGTLVTAQAVKATFQIHNNGLSGMWTNTPPPSGNPTPERDIAPATAFTFATEEWNLNNQEKQDYTANPGQCVRVELSSSNPNTIFVNKWAFRNMQFVTASSPFRERAIVSTRGIDFRGDTLGFTLRERFVNFDPQLTWTTEVGNATGAGDHVYKAKVRKNTDHELRIMVDPPRVSIPSTSVRVGPGTGGPGRPPVTVDVEPDQLLTFVASGTLQIDGRSVTAAGARHRRRKDDRMLNEGDRDRIGALVGSFDGFQESEFLISNAATVKVPRDARRLQIKINDDSAEYAKHRGEGFDVQVVRTRIEPWMASTNPDLRRAVHGADVLVTLGANLPTWLLRGERDTGRYIRIGNKTYRVYESVGSFGYIVRSIR
jgi:hypothetical protein